LPAAWGVSLNVDILVTDSDGIADSRSEFGDSKNWASQVGERRNGLMLEALFNEELGVVVEVAGERRDAVLATLRAHGLGRCSHVVGRTHERGLIEVWRDARLQFSATLQALHQAWDEVSWRIARLRDHPDCADAEHAAAGAPGDPGLHRQLSFDPADDRVAPAVVGARPKAAVLREQGVNSQLEMSRVLDLAGFDTYDVHMSDLQASPARLQDYLLVVACGGFSYGDTLGAGEGWARSILFDPRLAEAFAAHFARTGTLTLGVCNGCQMLAALAPLIPGAQDWPRFVRNRSQQFEPGCRWWRCCPAPACSSAAWRAAGCPLPSRMARAGPTSRAAVMPRAWRRRCASWTTTGRPPRPTPSTPTAAPAG
jgi:phosphoribosylformylglycinamidine synthase